jgi:hypothetical protein
VKQKKHKGGDKSDSDDSVERSRSRSKKDKIAALKSAIIKKKGMVGSDSESPSQWSGDGKYKILVFIDMYNQVEYVDHSEISHILKVY